MKPRAFCATMLLALSAGGALAQERATPDTKAADSVVPYCIEPMESMPPKIVALIDPQFRCEAGTHLKRDSRPAVVVPTGEESSGRPFVLRFSPADKVNAWYVRGYTNEK